MHEVFFGGERKYFFFSSRQLCEYLGSCLTTHAEARAVHKQRGQNLSGSFKESTRRRH